MNCRRRLNDQEINAIIDTLESGSESDSDSSDFETQNPVPIGGRARCTAVRGNDSTSDSSRSDNEAVIHEETTQCHEIFTAKDGTFWERLHRAKTGRTSALNIY